MHWCSVPDAGLCPQKPTYANLNSTIVTLLIKDKSIIMVVEVKAPSPGESVTEVGISSWYVKNGDYVRRDDKVADIESDKAMLELYAEESGQVTLLASEGDTVSVGSVIFTLNTSAAPSAAASTPAAATTTAAASPSPTPATTAAPASANTTYATGVPSPSADRILHEKGLTAQQVTGSGRDGRITKGDVLAYSPSPSDGNGASAPKTAAPAASSAPTPPKTPGGGERVVRREKMSKLRQTLASRLVSVKQETAMLTTFNEVDMSAIMDTRKRYKDRFKEVHQVNLGFMSFFSKACAIALQEFKAVNASIDKDEIVYHDYVDMSIAVSTDRGLVVPVVRNVESLSLADIEAKIMELAERARINKISIDEMLGGTFTITNGGVFGSLMSTPILNPPQSAILGMHKIQERPMVINGQIVARPMMYLALSYDHRIVDGRESVSFLVRVKELLEDPIRLLLHV
jgi:2-oxoglutarate dehydrogenase E2 component (dihydrolipoamide succinyltransferase)